MRADKTILVVGGEGRIGKALVDHLRRAGETVVATSRRPGRDGRDVFLDLAGDPDGWKIPDGVAAVVICAAQTRLEACERDPAAAWKVNVAGPAALVSRLPVAARIVFLSTSLVFDGLTPYPDEDAALSPVSEYGRQKAEAERLLSVARPEATTVMRLTKVFDPNAPLVRQWATALGRGEAIEPFADMVFSPVPLAGVAAAVRLALDRGEPGVLHWSGERDVSYAEFALALADRLGAPRELVRPVAASSRGIWPGPPRTTMGMRLTREALGVVPPLTNQTLATELGRLSL